MTQDPRQFLEEEAQVQWRRDWDVMLVGYVLGVLTVLAVQGLW